MRQISSFDLRSFANVSLLMLGCWSWLLFYCWGCFVSFFSVGNFDGNRDLFSCIFYGVWYVLAHCYSWSVIMRIKYSERGINKNYVQLKTTWTRLL